MHRASKAYIVGVDGWTGGVLYRRYIQRCSVAASSPRSLSPSLSLFFSLSSVYNKSFRPRVSLSLSLSLSLSV